MLSEVYQTSYLWLITINNTIHEFGYQLPYPVRIYIIFRIFYCLPLSFSEKQLKLKADELISKISEIYESNSALAAANQRLEVKRSELNDSNRSLFESNRELAEINKEFAETSKAFALTNKQFAELNQELTAVSKELAFAYRTIEQQNKTYAEFINIASHELRTPAQAILGFAGLAKQNPAFQEDKEGVIDAIYRNAFRLDRLINNILDVTRIEAHTLDLHKQRFNLNDVLSKAVEDTQALILANSKIKLSLSLDKSSSSLSTVLEKHEGNDDFISVEADRERIKQVLYNLLHNAIKFTKQGIISVTVERKKKHEDDAIVVSVKDSGSGIHPEITPKLFSKFATKSFSGTGLGLYISKSIIEAHGGKIWAENNPDGKGATFSFSLPLDK
jgi:signal transduction histidine kinase